MTCLYRFILKMILSLEPVDGFFSKLAKIYLLDKTESWFGFGDPFFQGHRRIFP